MGGVTEYWWILALALLIGSIALQIVTNKAAARAMTEANITADQRISALDETVDELRASVKDINDAKSAHSALIDCLHKLEQAIDVVSVSNLPHNGFPTHIEAAWEDVGEHGRFLTDLGGMSVAMREQIYHVFLKALNTPITTTMPAAGSPLDILSDMDEWMTREYKEKDKPLVLVQRG